MFYFVLVNCLFDSVPMSLGENRCGSLDLLTFALDSWRRFEHVPQGFVTRVTVGRHVIVHGNELMSHVIDRVHSVLKQGNDKQHGKVLAQTMQEGH